ncbi:hypothetical protein SLEP1_g6271 [Rubroshorea leprosula]|uniref:Uncharacterized protein n=1 Tax=Rubroshorea leprosula TaxID=152421 RepID=A0AAV5I5G8_9ROSI|nr:hypothetical protein SLEP1_g6271 [Rubroshorea leprosula]
MDWFCGELPFGLKGVFSPKMDHLVLAWHSCTWCHQRHHKGESYE